MTMIGARRKVNAVEAGQPVGTAQSTGLNVVNPDGSPVNVSVAPLAAIAGRMGGLSPIPDFAAQLAAQVPALNIPPHIAQPHRKFFTGDGTGTGNRIVGILGDALAGLAGQGPIYGPMMERRRHEQAQFAHDDASEARRLNQPRVENVPNVGLVRFDPATNNTQTLVAAKTPGQIYAEAQGYQEGSPEYSSAVADYALKGWGPTAYGYKGALQDDKQEAAWRALEENINLRRQLADLSARTSTANNIRSTSTSAANSRRSTAQSGINNQRSTATSAANSVLTNQTRLRTARHVGAIQPNEPVAVGPDGRKIVVRNGQWVDAQTGHPVQ